MKKIAVVTDSNGGITQEAAKQLGVYVVPMPFYIDGEIYFEDITLSQKQFYQKLQNDAQISTSQPAPADILDMWDKLLEEYDEIVHIPMSSALSSTCESAKVFARDYNGKVQVVDNQRISVSLKESVLDALDLAGQGKTASEIKEILEKDKLEASIYITVDTLKYLKKGGRVTPAAAAIGTALNIKPVLQIQGEKLDSFAKARGWKSAKKIMLAAMEEDLEGRFAKTDFALYIATTCNPEETAAWKAEVEARFSDYEVLSEPLSLSIACHTGPGAMGVGVVKKSR